jgi:hypothetical protein
MTSVLASMAAVMKKESGFGEFNMMKYKEKKNADNFSKRSCLNSLSILLVFDCQILDKTFDFFPKVFEEPLNCGDFLLNSLTLK